MAKACAEREGGTEERRCACWSVMKTEGEWLRTTTLHTRSHPFPHKKKPHTQLAVVQLLVVVRGMVVWVQRRVNGRWWREGRVRRLPQYTARQERLFFGSVPGATRARARVASSLLLPVACERVRVYWDEG